MKKKGRISKVVDLSRVFFGDQPWNENKNVLLLIAGLVSLFILYKGAITVYQLIYTNNPKFAVSYEGSIELRGNLSLKVEEKFSSYRVIEGPDDAFIPRVFHFKYPSNNGSREVSDKMVVDSFLVTSVLNSKKIKTVPIRTDESQLFVASREWAEKSLSYNNGKFSPFKLSYTLKNVIHNKEVRIPLFNYSDMEITSGSLELTLPVEFHPDLVKKKFIRYDGYNFIPAKIKTVHPSMLEGLKKKAPSDTIIASSHTNLGTGVLLFGNIRVPLGEELYLTLILPG